VTNATTQPSPLIVGRTLSPITAPVAGTVSSTSGAANVAASRSHTVRVRSVPSVGAPSYTIHRPSSDTEGWAPATPGSDITAVRPGAAGRGAPTASAKAPMPLKTTVAPVIARSQRRLFNSPPTLSTCALFSVVFPVRPTAPAG